MIDKAAFGSSCVRVLYRKIKEYYMLYPTAYPNNIELANTNTKRGKVHEEPYTVFQKSFIILHTVPHKSNSK